jgi:ABC-type Fe3+-siderophore transport system permease subunit
MMVPPEAVQSTGKALEVWTAQTVCDLGILLSIVSFLLHIGRPYFDRILSRFSLRVAADIWWIVYIVLRDGTLFFALLFGLSHLNLDIMSDIKVGLPFVPLGTVSLAGALLLKVFRNTEDINTSFRRATYLVSLGAFLNTIGYVLVMEGAGEEYAASKTWFWKWMESLRSDQNPQLATIIFYISWFLLVCFAAIATLKVMQLYRSVAGGEGKNV